MNNFFKKVPLNKSLGNIVSSAVMKKSFFKKRKATIAGKSKNEKMSDILAELKQKMMELNELKSQLSPLESKKISAQKTRQMLEEIVVPPLELIKEQKRKK